MSETSIEWTEHTWNPVTGCDRVSPGCANCYALTLAGRLKAMGNARYQRDGGRASGPGFGVTLHYDKLEEPLRWRRPRRVFVNSMSDLFHTPPSGILDDLVVTDAFLYDVFAVMAMTPQHTYQILTKRPERMHAFMTADGTQANVEEALDLLFQRVTGAGTFLGQWPLPNVWLGVSVENQRMADERIPLLLETPAAVRFLSCEPLLGPVDVSGALMRHSPIAICADCRGAGCEECATYDRTLDWIIVGGESGPRRRPMDLAWARSIVEQCRAASVACFVKQLGGARPGTRLEDLPADLRVREYPDVAPLVLC